MRLGTLYLFCSGLYWLQVIGYVTLSMTHSFHQH